MDDANPDVKDHGHCKSRIIKTSYLYIMQRYISAKNDYIELCSKAIRTMSHTGGVRFNINNQKPKSLFDLQADCIFPITNIII